MWFQYRISTIGAPASRSYASPCCTRLRTSVDRHFSQVMIDPYNGHKGPRNSHGLMALKLKLEYYKCHVTCITFHVVAKQIHGYFYDVIIGGTRILDSGRKPESNHPDTWFRSALLASRDATKLENPTFLSQSHEHRSGRQLATDRLPQGCAPSRQSWRISTLSRVRVA